MEHAWTSCSTRRPQPVPSESFPACSARRPKDRRLLFPSNVTGVVKPTTPQLYPMYLISVADLLGETTLRPHQHLLRDGKLVQYDAQYTGRVVFVSHRNWRASNPRLNPVVDSQINRLLLAHSLQSGSPGASPTRMEVGSASFRAFFCG